MKDRFYRFPHTPHLAWLGTGRPRDDKVLTAAQARELLSGDVVIEEKVDGANLGLSPDAEGRISAWNRGQFLLPPFAGQFARLSGWLALHADTLAHNLRPDWIAFGEWCAARHSIAYDRLPDWWLAFDIYDAAAGRFLPSAARDAWAQASGLCSMPVLFRGRTSLKALIALLASASSRFGSGPPEGLVVRKETSGYLQSRAKLVRAEFTQTIDEHWRRRPIEWNRLAADAPVSAA